MLLKPFTSLQILLLSLILFNPNSTISNGFSSVEAGAFYPGEEEPVEMESEISRRMLMMQRRYISYATLKRDMVPCDNAGASYYDCHRSRPANTYTRGCEVITRCARDIKDLND